MRGGRSSKPEFDSAADRQYLDDVAERDFVSGVVQLANLLTRRLAPVFEKANITPQQWAVLAALADAGDPTTLAAIARSLLVSKQNMTGMVARLEQLGLVERNENPDDLRSARVQLTRRGRSVVEKLRPAYEKWVGNVAGLSDRDLQALARTVDRLIEKLND
jgi:DNA-binding MarR family transcriptional regulator